LAGTILYSPGVALENGSYPIYARTIGGTVPVLVYPKTGYPWVSNWNTTPPLVALSGNESIMTGP